MYPSFEKSPIREGFSGSLISIMCRPPLEVFVPTAYARSVASLITRL